MDNPRQSASLSKQEQYYSHISTHWNNKTPREVAREAAAKGDPALSLVIRYLQGRLSWDENTASEWFHTEVRTWVLQLLMGRQYFKASHILTKIKEDVNVHMLDIARNTSDGELRNYILEQLMANTKKKERETDENIENSVIYSETPKWIDTMNHYCLLQSIQKSFKADGVIKPNRVFGTESDKIIVNLSEINRWSITELENRSDEWKSKLASHLFLSNIDERLVAFLNCNTLWNTLKQYSDTELLKQWINVSFCDENYVNSIPEFFKGYSRETVTKLCDIMKELKIDNDMILQIYKSSCYDYTKQAILNTLCHHGNLILEEQTNLQSFLKRHIISENISKCDMTNQREILNDLLIKYCLERELYHVLMKCADYSHSLLSYCQMNLDQSCITRNMFDLWVVIKDRMLNDNDNIFSIIYETCKYLCNENGIDGYLSENPSILLALILTCKSTSVFDIFNGKPIFLKENIEVSCHESIKSNFNHLYTISNKFVDKSFLCNNDVTVYQLLSGYLGLDVSKIFRFQLVKQQAFINRKSSNPSNTNSDVSDSDSYKKTHYDEIFNFSHPDLVKKYGFKRNLDYQYYLKQNRACMASQALLLKEYQKYGKRNVKNMKEACGYAHNMAIENWNNPVTSATCIAFISMIGFNSLQCRTDVSCANIIYNHFLSLGKTSEESQSLVNSLLNNHKGNQDTLSHLENIAMSNYQKCKNEGTLHIGNILNQWQTVARYANIHNLSMPTSILKMFTTDNLWLEFLIFGDIFKYSPKDLSIHCKHFSDPAIVEHLNHIIMCAGSDSTKSNTKHSSQELFSPNDETKDVSHGSVTKMEVSFMEDLWEVMSHCHGPVDPPGALIKASATLSCPLLALIATCYEPEAFDICWAVWILSNIDDSKNNTLCNELKINETEITVEQVKNIMNLAIETGHCATLLESFQIFYQENPLIHVVQFIKTCLIDHIFDEETATFMENFKNAHSNHVLTMRRNILPRIQRPIYQHIEYLLGQLLISALSVMESSSEQKMFLDCISVNITGFNLEETKSLLNLSIRCDKYLNFKEIFGDGNSKYHEMYIDYMVSNKFFEEALEYAKIVNHPIDSILMSLWIHKFDMFINDPYDKEFTSLKFWTECSENLKSNTMVDLPTCINFLMDQTEKLTSNTHRFYFMKVICSWFDLIESDKKDYDILMKLKDSIETEMWLLYFEIDGEDIVFMSVDDTIKYILENNTTSNKFYGYKFNQLLKEIEEQSPTNDQIAKKELSDIEIQKFNNAIKKLIDCGLILEAFRLNKTFPSYNSSDDINPLNMVIISLQIAEGIINPKDILPSNKLNNYIKSIFKYQSSLEELEYIDDEFEELVLVKDKNEDPNETNINLTEFNSHLAGRREAECLQVLDVIASKNNLKIIKIISDIYRISLQIGYTYEKVLKYEKSPLDFINHMSGIGRMPLLKVILRTYEISSEEVVEFLSFDIVTALISPHLTKTVGFKQKEIFHYTLWGYRIDSDFDMFLNLCPDDNSLLGGTILQYLAAFRKYYKNESAKKVSSNSDNEDEENLPQIDEDTQIDNEENSKVHFDTQSIISSAASSSTPSKKISKDKRLQMDVISCTSILIKSGIKSRLKDFVKGKKLTTKQINIVSVELLILAHECFSSVCDTEGIAMVLRSAQVLTTYLLAARSWRLIVHLLIGIARYTEMAYAFQILRDNHQFEYLLGQDHVQHDKKKINFKHGLLEFLKKNCPGDTELYCLVALHFSMYSEAADLKKKQANDLIVTLIQIALDAMKALNKRANKQPEWIILANTDNNKLLLDTAINHCSDAAELYAKGNSLNAAREMAGLAQLLALQYALLSKTPVYCILNLAPHKMNELISTHFTFMESVVFATANEGCDSGWMDRWRELIYQRVIKRGDPVFVADILTNRPDIALYILNRYNQENNRIASAEMAINELRLHFK